MAKYKDKWKTTFPASIGNQTRPEDGVDNTQEYNTDGLPQYMANDPVRYDLQNAVNSQLVSNDERLNEKIKRTSDDLAAHNKDPKAHATGISGNAATASKLATPRTLSLTGKATGSTTFDGSANASINVTNVNADTASKLSTARKINITGNATGAANFDGSSDISISTTVNESKHATAADTLKSSPATETSTVARPVWLSWEGDNTKQTVSPNLTYTCSTKTLTAANFVGHLTGNADTATRAAAADNADKLATARTISLTGNASGSANFDGSGDISISTTVNESKHAVNADTATNAGNADKVDGYHASDLLNQSIRVGVVLPFSGSTIPSGYLPCNGAAVSRTTYKALFDVIGTTYGTGDGSMTFNLPDLVDKFIEGSTTAGTVKAAGLPNITGSTSGTDVQGDFKGTGAFYVSSWGNYNDQGGSYHSDFGKSMSFDASRVNSIYGNSDTVQPPAVTMQYIIKY